jgi:DNA (cytosine-5)-methyltransferase 1
MEAAGGTLPEHTGTLTDRNRPLSGKHRIPVIDLFAGPGGLGEGFSAPGADGSASRFRIALSIEKDLAAHSTLELRAIFRQFHAGEVPEEYYQFVRGTIDRDQLYSAPALQSAVRNAQSEAWLAELGGTPEREILSRVRDATGTARESVLIGGPPCQAYSLVGRSRNRGNPDYDPSADGRHSLYREYLKVLVTTWPMVFVMENVKGLLSSKLNGQSVFSRILEDLQDPVNALKPSCTEPRHRYRILALSAEDDGQVDLLDTPQAETRRFIIRCENYGIPQARHRVILLGVREDIPLPRGTMLPRRQGVSAGDVLRGLPVLRSGISREADSPESWYQVLTSVTREKWLRRLRRQEAEVADTIEQAVERARSSVSRGGEFLRRSIKVRAHAEWYLDSRLGGVPNHATRSHIPSDLKRYLFSSSFARVHGRSPVLADFPTEILPQHRNVAAALNGSMFQDRFRVQVAGRPASTVTSHISKDGHYYIHYDPAQCRSLTAREAARLQTFPDNYFFCGGRTAQYHQIGNAVPPLLAREIAAVVAYILQ